MGGRANPERRYNYDNQRTGNFQHDDQVTVTMTNGCRANGTVVIEKGYGMTPTTRDPETHEIIYRVKIESGPLRGVTYYANESQLTSGWSADAAGNTCENGGTAHERVGAADDAHEAHAGDIDAETFVSLGIVAIIVTAVAVAFAAATSRTQFAAS